MPPAPLKTPSYCRPPGLQARAQPATLALRGRSVGREAYTTVGPRLHAFSWAAGPLALPYGRGPLAYRSHRLRGRSQNGTDLWPSPQVGMGSSLGAATKSGAAAILTSDP